MTVQLDDHVFHNKILYMLTDVAGKGLFLPQRYGIEPEIITTDCHRGFQATYEVRDSQLYLTNLYINLRRKDSRKGERGELQFAPGIKAIRDRHGGTYLEELAFPILFTGGLVLADGFIRDESVHWHSRPTWCHNDVRELVFQKGRLTEDHDRSQQIAEVREKMKEHSLEPDWKRNRIASELTGLIFSRKYCE